ncbi:MAG: HAD family hydrolase [Paracoccaceae bacterium]
MDLRALIFDVDGTLAETEEAHRQAFNETFAEAGIDWSWSRDDYRVLLRTTGGKERMRAHREAVGFGPSDAEIPALHAAKTARYGQIIAEGGVPLRPGVEGLIRSARKAGLKLAVATTTNRPNVDALISATLGQPADQVFDVIAAGDEVTAKKPAPDVYLLALERLGLRPDHALAFEDSVPGLRSARAAGLKVVVTPSVYTAGEDFSTANWLMPDLCALWRLIGA